MSTPGDIAFYDGLSKRMDAASKSAETLVAALSDALAKEQENHLRTIATLQKAVDTLKECDSLLLEQQAEINRLRTREG